MCVEAFRECGGDVSNSINRAQFDQFFNQSCPCWRGETRLIDLLFRVLDKSGAQAVDLVDVTGGLSVIVKGSLAQRLHCT